MPKDKAKTRRKKVSAKTGGQPIKTVKTTTTEKTDAVVTDKDRLQFAQKQARDRQMVIDELIQINADQTLTIAKQRATIKLYTAQAQQIGD